MNWISLILVNLAGSGFRSFAVAFCVFLLTCLTLVASLVNRGAEDGLRLGLERLGADVVVLPKGVEARVESALLTGKPVSTWMPEGNLEKVVTQPGVASASPQVFLASLKDAPCCAVSEMFIIVFDPRTDFTVQPWLSQRLGRTLGRAEVIGGSNVFVPDGPDYPQIRLYGYLFALVGSLEPTGTGLDHTMFMDITTAREMARASGDAVQPLVIPDNSISAVLVKARPSVDPQYLASQISKAMPEVQALESSDLFRSARQEMTGLGRTSTIILSLLWVLAVALLALLFSLTANERRREIAVLRAVGAPPGFVFRTLLGEAGILALGGSALGIIMAGATTYLFRQKIALSLGIPFLFPPLPESLLLAAWGLFLPPLVVMLAALYPARRLSRLEPALAMRE